MTTNDEATPGLHDIPEVLPVLPAVDIVAFPGVLVSMHIGRKGSLRALEEATRDGRKMIFLIAQQKSDSENPRPEDLFQMGVVANVVRTLRMPDGNSKVLLQGFVRAHLRECRMNPEGFLEASVEPVRPIANLQVAAEDELIMNRIREHLEVLVEYEHLPEEILVVTGDVDDPGVLSDIVLAHYRLDLNAAQTALEELDPLERLRLTDRVVSEDLNQFLVFERIRSQAQDELSKDQKDYFLREQIKQIKRELGEEESGSEDLSELKKALEQCKLPEHAKKEVSHQLRRLERMHVEASEYSLIRTYLEWVSDLPWAKRTKEKLDLKNAKKILDKDHFGLEKVKDRILEYLSVRKLKKDPKGPILCFVGPPGVGKTSLGASIAAALNRSFYRVSLGGIRDEAEIRGHRRTYVGALPGKIIQGLKTAGSKNPLFVLDELDKVGADFRGDPASALLEVLDPSQNRDFMDHYLNMPFDLSEVMFIATANTTDTIPEALLDRLEVIHISGYTTHEKVQIARNYLIPRQLLANGLEKFSIEINDETLLFLVDRYTREAGVRNLEREIGAVFRKVARQFVEKAKDKKAKKQKIITEDFIREALGPTRFDPEYEEDREEVGLVRGLAWTRVGGEILLVEASTAKGKGALILTGQLGDVMQESGRAALFYARSHAEELGLDPNFYHKLDIHIHVPNGATPKDGPSAGIAIATALVSNLSGRTVSKDVAMTGEITLRGNVLAIGGIREKALAALRYGIKKVIIPYDNIKDLEDVPKEQRDQIKFIPVKHVREVLEIALARPGARKVQAKTVKTNKASRVVQKNVKAPERRR